MNPMQRARPLQRLDVLPRECVDNLFGVVIGFSGTFVVAANVQTLVISDNCLPICL